MTIGYIMLGAGNPAKAKAFYEPLLAQLGFKINPAYSNETRTWLSRRPAACRCWSSASRMTAMPPSATAR